MTTIPLEIGTQSNYGRYGQDGAARLINCYAEELGKEGKSPTPVYACAGLVLFATLIDGVTDPGLGQLLGRIVYIKINVERAYTGVLSNLTMTLGAQFGSWLIHPDWSQSRPNNARINLKAAGERIITPDGVTGTQTGDTNLTAFTGGSWIPINFGWAVFVGNNATAVNISGEDPSVRPLVTVEVLTDQEIPPMPS